MLRKSFFIVKYWLCWIMLFEAARLFFFICNTADAKIIGISNLFKSMWYGLRMDMSMAAYLTLPVAVIILLGVFLKLFHHAGIVKVYTAVILFFVVLLIGIDINIYKAWGYRIDASPLKYLKNPKEAWASVSNLPVVWIFIAFVAVFSFSIFLFNKFIAKQFSKLSFSGHRILSAVSILLLIGLFIIPLRGGFQLAPLNQSSVYFSDNNFANQSALNAPWNFLHSLSHNTESKTNPFIYVDEKEALAIKNSLFAHTDSTEKILNLPAGTKPNVIFIIWESFTEKVTHLQMEGIDITPKFNELKKEGIYFSNIYATGDRTDKGIVAILSGYPSQPTTSIVKTPVKSAKLPMVSKVLKEQGYNTSFYYGGELEFANMKAYLLGGGFKKFTSKNDFDAKDQNSKWGAHDGVVMIKVIEGLSKEPSPFFCTWLTLSSHEPFETPVPSVLKGTDDVSLFLNSLHYTDQVVYDFIQQCKQQSWWKNTLIVITADHGHRLPPTGKKIDDFKMPVMLLGGALAQGGIVKDRVGSQIDIPATVLAQLNISSTQFAWSKNLLNKSTMPWAYFSFNNGYGFVQPNNYFIFDNVGKLPMEQNGNPSAEDIKKGKAIQQLTFGDYLSK